MYNEGERLKVIYTERAKQVSLNNLRAGNQEKLRVVPIEQVGETRKIIADKVGLASGTYGKLEQLGNAARDGNPIAKELMEKIDAGKKTIGSGYAVLNIHKRRQKTDNQISGEGKTRKIPDALNFC